MGAELRTCNQRSSAKMVDNLCVEDGPWRACVCVCMRERESEMREREREKARERERGRAGQPL